MKTILLITVHIIVTLFKLSMPGGLRKIVAENVLIKQQLIAVKRSKRKCPDLLPVERLLFGFWAFVLDPKRLLKSAIIIKPATLLKFHKLLVKRKYSKLFSGTKNGKPGPKGPSQEVIDLVLAIKTKNPGFGCPKIALIVENTFQIALDKDDVRRILAKYFKPNQPVGPGDGPSWLTFFADLKDSLWSLDFFRVESTLLESHWVMVVMDQYSRKIIGFAVKAGALTGMDIALMFCEIAGEKVPKFLSTDNDPLFKSLMWQFIVDGLEIKTLKSQPGKPWTHPFVERLIGSCRREFTDHVFFFNEVDLKRKLENYQAYFNDGRVHYGLFGKVPMQKAGDIEIKQAEISNYRWRTYCSGRFQVPFAA